MKARSLQPQRTFAFFPLLKPRYHALNKARLHAEISQLKPASKNHLAHKREQLHTVEKQWSTLSPCILHFTPMGRKSRTHINFPTTKTNDDPCLKLRLFFVSGKRSENLLATWEIKSRTDLISMTGSKALTKKTLPLPPNTQSQTHKFPWKEKFIFLVCLSLTHCGVQVVENFHT